MSAVSEAQRKQKVISDERRRFEEDNYRRLVRSFFVLEGAGVVNELV